MEIRTGTLNRRRDGSSFSGLELIDSTRSLLGMKQPLFPVPTRHGTAALPLWASILGVIYIVTTSVLAGVGLASLFSHHRQAGHLAMQSFSSKHHGPRIETLQDFIEQQRAPDRLLEASDVSFCPNITEPKLERIPEKIKMLMLVGTQKTGTTWLFQALIKHPSFIPSLRRPGEDSHVKDASFLSKELQYFNRWPMLTTEQYLHAWHSGVVGAMMSGAAGHRVLLDASPQYLMSAVTPPRIKAAAPHAKFVLVIRDPPMRTMSDYIMMSRLQRCYINPSRLCPNNRTFAEQIDLELNDPNREEACFFNSSASAGKAWFDCFRCSYNYIENGKQYVQKACMEGPEVGGPPEFRNCTIPHYGFIDHGLYGAQFAWWLRFFRPEQFLVVSAWQLRDPDEAVKVLNHILEHAGMAGAPPFTAEMIEGVRGFRGGYKTENMSDSDLAAMDTLREFFRKDQEDLKALMDALYPEQNFTVEEEEW